MFDFPFGCNVDGLINPWLKNGGEGVVTGFREPDYFFNPLGLFTVSTVMEVGKGAFQEDSSED